MVEAVSPILVSTAAVALAAVHLFAGRYSFDPIPRSYWLSGAGGVLAGLAVGMATSITERAVSVLFALLAGGIILNVIKEELPEERRSNFWAFGGGAGAYAILLLLL